MHCNRAGRHPSIIGSTPYKIPRATNSDSKSFDPLRQPGETAKGYPNKTIVILDTGLPGQQREYRVGIMTREDFEAGFRCGRKGVSLNKFVAERVFTGKTYQNEMAAEKGAESLIPADDVRIGIKMLQFHQEFPGIEGQVLKFHEAVVT